MAPKKAKTSDVAGSSTGRGKKRASSGVANELGIIFKNKAQKERYESHEGRKLSATRYPDFSFTLQTLGIEDNVILLLNNLGWLSFLRPARATYYALTREFLSSLCLVDDKLSFRLFNEDYEMSLDEFGEKLGFANVGLIHDSRDPALRPKGYSPNAFWTQITGKGQYEARAAKAGSIHNPVFRYIARVMACTICGRGEMGGVRTGELFLLWAMVNQLQANTCHYIIDNLIHVSELNKGDIVIGGMVTFIVQKLGLEYMLKNLDAMEGSTSIDMEMCNLMFLVRPANNVRTRFHLLIEKQKSILMPNTARTDTRIQENWLYLDAAGEISQEVPMQEEEMDEQAMQDEPDFNIQEWCLRIQGEQQRHGAELQVIREEQLNQNQQMAWMTGMLEAMMQHFGIDQPPPPGQL